LRLGLVFFAAVLLLAGGSAGAQSGADATTVVLAAPDSIRAFLTEHLDLPAHLPDDDTARAAFARRAIGEVSELLATEGYFAPRVNVRTANGERTLHVEVTPGPRTLVGAVDIEFRGDLSGAGDARPARRAALRAAWALGVGEAFRSPAWEAAKAALLAAVAGTDYAAAQIVESAAEVDPESARARLHLVLDSGPAYRFGATTVSGLARYDRQLVDRLAPFRPGAPYRRDQLLSFQSRLQSTPYFHSVMVTADPDTAQGTTLPVHVALIEAHARQVGLGLGYSTNSGARSELNYRNRDFLGSAWNLSSGLRIEQNKQSLFSDVETQPDALGYRLSLGPRAEASDIEGLISTRQVLGVGRSRTQGQIETRLGLDWQREHQRPSGGTEQDDRALALVWRWIQRSVDDPLKPRSGHLIELRLAGATQRLLSDQDFVHSHLRVQTWWPLGERDTFSLRGEAGVTAARSRSGIPQEYLFRAGGTQSVRGYNYQSLGVHDGSAVVGGRALATGSAEYTHWFTADWGGALFADAGNAGDRWRELKPVHGYGLGARWRTPAGPLALDLAWGEEVKRWQVHFSVAVAF
jgi:translocation and assembly module TamA